MNIHYFPIISHFRVIGSSFLFELDSVHSRMFIPSLVQIDPVVLKKKDYKKNLCVYAVYCFYIPLKSGLVLHLYKAQSLSLEIMKKEIKMLKS